MSTRAASLTLQIRLVAPTQAAAEEALARLTLMNGTLHWSAPRQGRRGAWLIYGRLALDAAPGRVTPHHAALHETHCPGAERERLGVEAGRESL